MLEQSIFKAEIWMETESSFPLLSVVGVRDVVHAILSTDTNVIGSSLDICIAKVNEKGPHLSN